MNANACPFCKSRNIRIVIKAELFEGNIDAQDTITYVKCGTCGARGPHVSVTKPETQSAILESRDKSISMWNKVPRQ